MTLAGYLTARTLGFFRPEADDLLPLALRLTVVAFTFEATRMFVHVIVGGSFYESAPPLDKDQFNPLVSVVIPAWNEEIGLARTIDSVLASDYSNLEIIVVNDGSTDGTASVAEPYQTTHPDRIRLLTQMNGGKGSALNNGVLHSLGDIIVNIDADSAVRHDAISNLVRPFAGGGVDAVVGRVVVGNTDHFLGRTQAFEYMLGFHLRRAQSVFNTIFILSGAMCAYRRSAYDKTLGFRDFSKTEDMDFSMQLRAAGCRLVYADDAVCVTEGAADLHGLRDQRTRWRYGAFACFVAHHDQFFDARRGHRSLGFYELPVSLFGYIQILMYPVVLALAFALPIYTGQYIYLLMILLSVPLNFAIVFWVSGAHLDQVRFLPIQIVLMCTMMAVEHITMWRALRFYATGHTLTWTTWQRHGVGETAGTFTFAGVPSVTTPATGVLALASTHPGISDLDASTEALDIDLVSLELVADHHHGALLRFVDDRSTVDLRFEERVELPEVEHLVSAATLNDWIERSGTKLEPAPESPLMLDHQ